MWVKNSLDVPFEIDGTTEMYIIIYIYCLVPDLVFKFDCFSRA